MYPIQKLVELLAFRIGEGPRLLVAAGEVDVHGSCHDQACVVWWNRLSEGSCRWKRGTVGLLFVHQLPEVRPLPYSLAVSSRSRICGVVDLSLLPCRASS